MRSIACCNVLFLGFCLALSFAPFASWADTEGDYTYTVIDGQAIITGFNASISGEWIIADTLGGYPVTSIYIWDYTPSADLTSIKIPASVTFIYESTFAGCVGLTNFTVEANNMVYSSLDGVLFDSNRTVIIDFPRGRTGSYTVPVGVTSIGDYAFAGCTGLTSVTISTGVTSIGEGAFAWCNGLTSVTMPVGVTSIGAEAFNGCVGVSSITIPAGVTSIGDYAFYGCTGLTSITMLTGVTSIGNGAFDDCSGLTSVTIPAGVTSIGDYAFCDCVGLTSVTIPASVSSLSFCVFVGCTGLTGVFFKGDAPALGGPPFEDSPAIVYYLPNTIGWGETFGGCPTMLWLSATFSVYFDAGDGTVNPVTKKVGVDGVFGTMPVPVYAGHTFAGWWTSVGNGGCLVTETTSVTNTADMTVYARYNQNPVYSVRTPATNPADINEGAAFSFTVKADDSTDPDVQNRGMSNILWFVDGVKVWETKAGAPGAISSSYTLKTDQNTVTFTTPWEYRDITVTASAFDKKGAHTDTSWTVVVFNVLASQTVWLPPLPAVVLGDDAFRPSVSASSGQPVRLTSSNESVATVKYGVIHIVGAGSTVITATQDGGFDYLPAEPVRRTLTVKVRLTTETPEGGGTVTGAGLYMPGTKVVLTAMPKARYTFLSWEDGSQALSRTLVMPRVNVTARAWFGITTQIPAPTVTRGCLFDAPVGVPYSRRQAVVSARRPTVTVTGLPEGLVYDPATKFIVGAPTVSVTNRAVTVTAKNENKTPGTCTFYINVDPLPPWAQGTFAGNAGTDAMGSGAATMSVTARGAVSGKIMLRGTNFTFSAKSFTSQGYPNRFELTTTAKARNDSMPLMLTLAPSPIVDTQGIVSETLSMARGSLNSDGWVTLYRNVWKDEGMVKVLTNNYTGYYTSVLPGGSEYGSGYLTFTVDKAGAIKTVGKLADGAALSMSSALILDEGGRACTVVYAAPTAYKGGGIYGVAVLSKPDQLSRPSVTTLEGEAFEWDNLNPAATARYGDGFNRRLALSGGWYDTVGNLNSYYSNAVLTVATDPSAPTPTRLVGTNRIVSAWWDPEGLVLGVATNKSGVMTGLTAQKPGTPIKIGTNAYDYVDATNAVGLTVSLTRATGVFKGSFKVWFDTGTTHTFKSVSYEGVLVPEQGRNDGCAGHGFFRWSDKGSYLNPQSKSVPYGYSWSYDLKILLSAP